MQQVCLSSLSSQHRFAISNSVSLKLSFILRWSCLIIRKEHTLSPEWLGGRSKGSWRFNPNKLGRKSGQKQCLLRGQTCSPKIVQIPTNLHLQQQLCKLPISSVQCPVSSTWVRALLSMWSVWRWWRGLRAREGKEVSLLWVTDRERSSPSRPLGSTTIWTEDICGLGTFVYVIETCEIIQESWKHTSL